MTNSGRLKKNTVADTPHEGISDALNQLDGEIQSLAHLADVLVTALQDQPELMPSVRQAIDAPRITESTLRDHRNMLNRILATSPDILLIKDRDSVIQAVSPAIAAVAGMTPAELVGKTDFDIFSPERAKGYFSEEQIVLESGKPVTHEEASTTSDETLWYHTIKAPIFAEDGEIVGIMCLVRDVTDRKKAEDELLASEARYRAIVEHQTELVARFRTDGTITFVNEACCRITGQSRDELVGSSFLSFLTEPERETLEAMLSALDADNPTATYESWSRTNGYAGWLQWTHHAVTDDRGEVVEIQVVGHDITTLKRLHVRTEQMVEDLRRQEHALQSLIDGMPAGVMLLDSDLKLLSYNKVYAQYFAGGKKWRVGDSLTEVLPGAEESGVLRVLRKAQKLRRPVRVKSFRYDGLQAGVTYWTGSVVPVDLRFDESVVSALAVVVIDVTDETLARERLAQMAVLAEERARDLDAERGRLQAVIQSVPLALSVFDHKGSAIAFNSAALDLAESLGLAGWLKSGGSIRALDRRAEMRDAEGKIIRLADFPVVRSLRGETCSDVIINYRVKRASKRTFSFNSAPLKDHSGQITGAVQVISDITEQERQREQIQEMYRREHAIADKLQQSFRLDDCPKIDAFEFGDHYQTGPEAEVVGGDFYDIFRVEGDRLGLVMADVAGKGYRAAVYSAMTKYMLRAYALEQSDPELVLARLNEALSACTPPEVFVTLVYGILDYEAGKFTYANAGHEPPIYLDARTGAATTIDVTGRALALAHGSSYTTQSIALHEGDILLFYTDGVTDAGSGCDRMGADIVMRLIESRACCRAQEIVNEVVNTAREFAGGNLADDAALLAVKILRGEM